MPDGNWMMSSPGPMVATLWVPGRVITGPFAVRVWEAMRSVEAPGVAVMIRVPILAMTIGESPCAWGWGGGVVGLGMNDFVPLFWISRPEEP